MGWDSKPKDPPPTQQEKDLAERSAKEHNRYVQRYVPAVQRAVEMSRVNEGDRQLLHGDANAAAASSAGGAGLDAGIVTQGLSSGASAGSGRVVGAIADARARFSTGVGAGRNAATVALDRRQNAGLVKGISTGRGVADNSSAGLASAGRRATEAAIGQTRRKLESKQATMSMVATIAGGAARGIENRGTVHKGGISKYNDGAGVAGSSKPWWDTTSGPRRKVS